MKKFFLLITFLFFTSCLHSADLMMELEGGNFKVLDEVMRTVNSPDDVAYYRALGEFYRGNLNEAQKILSSVSTQTVITSAWLKNYLNDVQPILSDMETSESAHFILRAKQRDKFLASYALETLEKAYREIGGELGAFPEGKVRVEIYPTQEAFSLASTLSKETLDRSGAIGICKFRRLMILSPEQLAFGYRWLDTLAHEYTHYLINIVSSGRCPLWLHEGIAKYYETRWRLKEPQYLIPGNETELVHAVNEDKLISFKRMEPSMVYLENQTQVHLAFSQVAHAVHYMQTLKGSEGVRKVLQGLAAGKTRDEAIRTAMDLAEKDFEQEWQAFLKKENLSETPGAITDELKLKKQADEVEEFVSTDLRGHLRLGDRMRQNGQLQVALIQYEKALKQEPYNPVALVKAARILIALGRENEAVERLETCAKQNPNYAPPYLLLCARQIEKKEWEKALFNGLEANAINPFNPEAHDDLARIYQQLGKTDLMNRELEVIRHLESTRE